MLLKLIAFVHDCAHVQKDQKDQMNQKGDRKQPCYGISMLHVCKHHYSHQL